MAFPRLLNIVLLLTLVLLPPSLFGQTLRVDHVEPPNWWAGMEWNTVQLMLYGENLDGITAISTHEGFKIKTIHQVPNSSYAFIDIELSGAITPGTYTLSIRRGEETLDVPYEIQEREPLDGRNQGFSVDDVVYLITPDRFANGNPQNDHVEGLFADTDRSQDHMRHGGDLEGLISRLDYLKNLGITAIWLNPVLENNFRNSYHGYAATDLYKIDPRFGTNEDYRRFVKEAQAHGIKVIFDHIANHIGIQHPWLSNLPTDTWLNGTADDHLTGKHYKMAFSDPYADPFSDQLLRGFWFVSAMPDLNQRDPYLATYLIQNTLWWMEYTGLDGIREDTYPYPDQEFLAEWAEAILTEYPSSNIVGEIWEDQPAYLSLFQKDTPLPRAFDTNLPTIMDFPLTVAWREYLEGKGGLDAVYKVLAQDFVYADPQGLMTFVDNHDMARSIFISDGHMEKLKQVFAMLLTTRGIPQLLYGSEINMVGGASHVELRADFPGGFPGDVRDAFTEAGRTDEEQEMFSFMQQLLHLRKDHAALRTGRLIHYPVIYGQTVYKYLRMDQDAAFLILINEEDRPQEVDLSEVMHWLDASMPLEDVFSETTYSLHATSSIPISALGTLILKVYPSQ